MPDSITKSDGNQVARWSIEDGVMYRERWQPNRAEILKMNQEVYDRGGSRRGDWGASLLNIPDDDYQILVKRYPDLTSWDAEIKRKAWAKFLASSESKPYRVYKPQRIFNGR